MQNKKSPAFPEYFHNNNLQIMRSSLQELSNNHKMIIYISDSVMDNGNSLVFTVQGIISLFITTPQDTTNKIQSTWSNCTL